MTTKNKVELSYPLGCVDNRLRKTVLDVLSSGQYVMGEQISGFEEDVKKYLRVDHAIAVSSGTAGLTLAATHMGDSAEAYVPTLTFIGTPNAMVYAGKQVFFLDSYPNTYCMKTDELSGVKLPWHDEEIIVPVHMYGHPCDMETIMEAKEKKDCWVLEDACQAFGAEYGGKKVGTLGDAGVFSFFPSKVLSVLGEGGMVVTNDENLAMMVRSTRNQGRVDGKHKHDYVGGNFRMSEIHAAIGRYCLRKVDRWIEHRRKVAGWYNILLKDLPLQLPIEKPNCKHVYYVYTVQVDNRDVVQQKLKDAGIQTGIYYPTPCHRQLAYIEYAGETHANAEYVCKRILSLPMHQYLKKKEVEYVSEVLHDIESP